MPDVLGDAELLARGAARLRVAQPAPYVYRGRLKRTAARALDMAGGALLRPPRPEVDWGSVRRVAVLRLDHLGDVINALPAVGALRRALPRAEIDLWVGPWSRELAAMAPAAWRVGVRIFDAPWFWRPRRVDWPWHAILGLGDALAQGGYDAAFELRGDLRHHLALRRSGIPVRAGQAVTAGGFLLTHPAVFVPGAHEQAQNVGTLHQAGLPLPRGARLDLTAAGLEAITSAARIQPSAAAAREAAALWRSLGLRHRVLAVQAACGTRAKRWPAGHWASLLDSLPRGVSAVLLGSAAEAEEMRALADRCRRRPALATGRLSLPGLAAFMRRCSALASVDSGPAHLASSLGLPVLALYSGTNLAAQWAPRGRGVRLLQGSAPCSPCELADCPFDNACMGRIGVDEASEALKEMLS